MAISDTPVQTASGIAGSATASITVSFAAAATGNLLTALVTHELQNKVATSITSGWNTALTGNDGVDGPSVGLYWKAATGGETSFTANFNNTSGDAVVAFLELPSTDLDLSAVEGSGTATQHLETATTAVDAGPATNTTADSLLIAGIGVDTFTGLTFSSLSTGWTEREVANATGMGTSGLFTKVVAATGAQSFSATINNARESWGGLITFPAAAAGGSITSVGGDDIILSSEASVAVVGSGLGTATKGTVYDGTNETLVTSYSASATGPTFTAPTATALVAGNTAFGSTFLRLKTSADAVVASRAITINPEDGYGWHDINSIASATDADSIYNGQSPAVTVSDYILFEDVTNTNAWAVTIATDGYPTAGSSGSLLTDNFDYYVYDTTTKDYGTSGSYEFTNTPILSLATGVKTGTSSGTLSVDTNMAEGTVWSSVTTATTTPTHPQIKAGQDHTSATAAYSASDTTPTQTTSFNATGLAADTLYYYHFAQENAAATPVEATPVSGGSFRTDVAADITPDQFRITDVSGVSPGTVVVSEVFSPTGVTASTNVPISVTGDAEYRINAGAWASAPGSWQLGQNIEIRLPSGDTANDTVNTTVNIGGVTDVWSVTTAPVANPDKASVRSPVTPCVVPDNTNTVHEHILIS